jgi:hypothetical protein
MNFMTLLSCSANGAALKESLGGYRAEVSCVAAEEVADAEFRHELFLTQGLAGRAMLVGERSDKLYGHPDLVRGQAP